MKRIYLDHAATTPLDKDVLEMMMVHAADVFGNPSSVHSFGRRARKYLEEARRELAQSVGATDKEIIFTSGGTEANNLAILGIARANKHRGKHIITAKHEHHATLHTTEQLEKEGFSVTYLDVTEEGLVRVEDVVEAIRVDTILVSLMYVNNETGMIQPIQEIGKMLKEQSILFHTDAVQAYGLIELNVDELYVDALSVSSHKINGPNGIGFLYVRQGVQIEPLLYGGEQERKRRAGTENVIGVIGFQKASEIVQETRQERFAKYLSYRDVFCEVLSNEAVEYTLNGCKEKLIPSTISLNFPNTHVEQLLMNFDLAGIAASSGSACTAGSVDPSHVLVAMYGEEDPRINQSIRFSFGTCNTIENVREAAEKVAQIVNRLQK